MQHQQTCFRLLLVKVAAQGTCQGSTSCLQSSGQHYKGQEEAVTSSCVSLSLQVLHSQWPRAAALPQVDHICLTRPTCLQVLCLQWPRGCPEAPALLANHLPHVCRWPSPGPRLWTWDTYLNRSLGCNLAQLRVPYPQWPRFKWAQNWEGPFSRGGSPANHGCRLLHSKLAVSSI